MKRRLWRMIHDRAGYTGLPLAFKGLLIAGLAVIAGVLVYSTHTMITELKASEARLANAYAGQWKRAAESTDSEEIDYLFAEIISKSDFPIIVADGEGHPLYWRGLDDIADDDTTFATRQVLAEMMSKMAGEYPPVPISYEGQLLYNLHYGNYGLVNAVRRLPYIGVAVMALFMLIAYVSFRYIKRAEQRYIWVGMAKETAHQLGTPLSSLMGWLERLSDRADGGSNEALSAMRADVERLKLVANRFGMIGSMPDKTMQSIEPVIREVVAYFRARLPHAGLGVRIDEVYQSTEPVPINADLVAWVMENLLKNSLEAVDSKSGRLSVAVTPHEHSGVVITVEDNGSGIAPRDQAKIFHAGFTSKKRGWGLGLTLARRITMEYHDGDLFLDESTPQKITRFVLHLPG